MRFLVGAIDEIFGLETLADQSALHIDHRDNDRIDGAAFGRLF